MGLDRICKTILKETSSALSCGQFYHNWGTYFFIVLQPSAWPGLRFFSKYSSTKDNLVHSDLTFACGLQHWHQQSHDKTPHVLAVIICLNIQCECSISADTQLLHCFSQHLKMRAFQKRVDCLIKKTNKKKKNKIIQYSSLFSFRFWFWFTEHVNSQCQMFLFMHSLCVTQEMVETNHKLTVSVTISGISFVHHKWCDDTLRCYCQACLDHIGSPKSLPL